MGRARTKGLKKRAITMAMERRMFGKDLLGVEIGVRRKVG